MTSIILKFIKILSFPPTPTNSDLNASCNLLFKTKNNFSLLLYDWWLKEAKAKHEGANKAERGLDNAADNYGNIRRTEESVSMNENLSA